MTGKSNGQPGLSKLLPRPRMLDKRPKYFDKRPHRREANFSRGGGNLMWHRPVTSNVFGCSSRADYVKDFFAAYTAAVTHNAFQLAGNPQNCSFPLGPPESSLQSASLSVQPFLQGRQTDRQTTLLRR